RHGSDSETGKLSLADLELDDEAHEVRRHGHVIELTNTEYRLLRYLLINAGRVLTRSQILDHVWHYDFGGDASVLETYISYLRRKVDRHPAWHSARSARDGRLGGQNQSCRIRIWHDHIGRDARIANGASEQGSRHAGRSIHGHRL